MKTTLKDQINAIQVAKSIVNLEIGNMRTKEGKENFTLVAERLNDAASTIASLRLIMSLSEPEQIEFLRNLKQL